MRIYKYTGFLCALFIIMGDFTFTVSASTQKPIRQQIVSETAILIDGNTGQVLFDKDMHNKMYPASITKIMTALLALEKGSLNDTLTMSHDAVFTVGRHTSHIALDVNEELSVEQALYAMAIVSANDAANGIAEHIGGSLEGFAGLMTLKAKEVGALNTNFTNAHGLPGENHYTTAYDMARIMMEAIKLPGFTELFSMPYYEAAPTNIQPESRYFWLRNPMIVGDSAYDGVIAAKTGWTTDAQHTLVTAARRNGRTLIAVVMKSSRTSDKWNDTITLLDYGFNEFSSVSFGMDDLKKDGYIISNVDGADLTVYLSSSKAYNFLLHNSLTKNDVEIEYVTENSLVNGERHVKAVFSLPTAYGGLMYTGIGELDVEISINDEALTIENSFLNVGNTQESISQNSYQEQERQKSKLSIYWIVIIVVVGIFTLLRTMRYIIRRRYRRRRYTRSRRDYYGYTPPYKKQGSNSYRRYGGM